MTDKHHRTGTPAAAYATEVKGISEEKEMAHLEGENLNSLFDTLEEWERHLAQLDFKSLRCDDDEFAP